MRVGVQARSCVRACTMHACMRVVSQKHLHHACMHTGGESGAWAHVRITHAHLWMHLCMHTWVCTYSCACVVCVCESVCVCVCVCV